MPQNMAFFFLTSLANTFGSSSLGEREEKSLKQPFLYAKGF